MIIYRYIDKEDEKIKYVGIVHSDKRTLEQRIYEHKRNDDWTNGTSWKIEYFEKQDGSRTDAEYLESHLISLYESYKWFNKAKREWGISCYLPTEFSWCEYVSETKNSTTQEKKKLEAQKNRELKEKKKLEAQQQKIKALNIFKEVYNENSRYIELARKILKNIDDGNCKWTGIDDYVRVDLNEDSCLIEKMKERCFRDTCRAKFKNTIPYIIDMSSNLDYENYNTQIVVCYYLMEKRLLKLESWIKDMFEQCVKDAKKVFKNNNEEYIKYISSLN